ncbi:MAG TPA: hypothetical protein DF699_14475, partial [Phycisphaerales bacterium]|nr:hypothetical protein [Phycisphaerales bacterium]
MSDSTMFESKPGFKRGGKRNEVPDMGRLFDRTPPHHIDAERSLIGSILLDPAVLNDVVELIPNGEMFYQESHGTIY